MVSYLHQSLQGTRLQIKQIRPLHAHKEGHARCPGIAAPNMAAIESLINKLQKKGFSLTKEDWFSDFLGIDIKTMTNGNLHLTQTGLIVEVVEAAGMKNYKSNWLPARQETLGSCPHEEPMQELWSYQSIIRMLLYLATNTRLLLLLTSQEPCNSGQIHHSILTPHLTSRHHCQAHI